MSHFPQRFPWLPSVPPSRPRLVNSYRQPPWASKHPDHATPPCLPTHLLLSSSIILPCDGLISHLSPPLDFMRPTNSPSLICLCNPSTQQWLRVSTHGTDEEWTTVPNLSRQCSELRASSKTWANQDKLPGAVGENQLWPNAKAVSTVVNRPAPRANCLVQIQVLLPSSEQVPSSLCLFPHLRKQF